MSLPPLYARWMTDALGRALHDEPRASCLNCPMSVESAGRPAEVAYFHPRSKCCTYLPVLSNFQVGQILRDEDPLMAFGRRTVRERLTAGVAVTPLGLAWPATFERIYDAKEDHEFGRRIDMRCPHYIDRDGGLCGVWKYRNGICSTWFCRHSRGEAGREVWAKVEEVLELIETVVTRLCMVALEVDADTVERLCSSDEPEDTLNGDVPITDALRRRAWGDWLGREEAFFLGCAEVLDGLTWSDVAAAGGPRLAARIETVREVLMDHDNEALPPFVRGSRIHPVLEDEQEIWVYGYRVYDMEPLPHDLHDLLLDLPAMPTEELLDRIVNQHRVGEPEQAVRWWLDQGYLQATLPD